MTMADFDSLFADNLRDFQPVMMQAQYGGRDNIGRARSSGSLDRSGRSSSAGIKSQQRASSLQSHRRQHSGGTSTLNFAAGDPFNEINMSEMWTDHGISPNGSPGPIDTVPLQSDQLLSFRSFQRSNFVLLNQWDQPVCMNVAAQLHGMFFLAESPWDANSGPAVPGSAALPKELTCYRRNLFQVSGSIHLPAVTSVIVSENDGEITAEDIQSGKRRVIQSLEATIGGIENVEHNSVKIITVPWKNAATAPAAAAQTTNATAPNPEEYPPTANTTGRPMEKEPAPLSFNYPPAYYANPNGIQPEEDEADSLKWQMNWKRLQFRSATANNGRRKDLQQHFLVKLSVYANLVTEDLQDVPTDKVERVLLCEAFSGAIIVRGRSPRNFSSRNDIPLTGSAIVSSRHSHNNASAQITSAAKKARHMSSGSGEDEGQSDVMGYTPDFASQYADYPLLDQPFQLNEMNFDTYSAQPTWMDPSSSLSMLQSPTGMMQQQQGGLFDPSGSYTNLSDPSGSRVNLAGMMYPEEFSPAATQTMFSQSMPATSMGVMAPPNISRHSLTRPTNSMESPSMDLLYEYFPIGVDDFMPPVEVVYRPHNAHHLTQAPPSKSSGRSKRLFSETPFE